MFAKVLFVILSSITSAYAEYRCQETVNKELARLGLSGAKPSETKVPNNHVLASLREKIIALQETAKKETIRELNLRCDQPMDLYQMKYSDSYYGHPASCNEIISTKADIAIMIEEIKPPSMAVLETARKAYEKAYSERLDSADTSYVRGGRIDHINIYKNKKARVDVVIADGRVLTFKTISNSIAPVVVEIADDCSVRVVKSPYLSSSVTGKLCTNLTKARDLLSNQYLPQNLSMNNFLWSCLKAGGESSATGSAINQSCHCRDGSVVTPVLGEHPASCPDKPLRAIPNEDVIAQVLRQAHEIDLDLFMGVRDANDLKRQKEQDWREQQKITLTQICSSYEFSKNASDPGGESSKPETVQ